MHRSSILAMFVLSAPNLALACDMAEKLRLTEEQKKLASRNAWTGVERAYEALLATKCPLEYPNLFLGAESARMLGKVFEQYERLEAALAVAPDATGSEGGEDPKPGILGSMEAIDGAYAKVEIRGDPRRRPVLSRPEMPFAPDQRKAVEWAQTLVAETGSFKGMLPFGNYVVGDVAFTVDTSPDWKIVEVGKSRQPTAVAGGTDPDAIGGTETQSAIRYASLVATAGPGFLATPEPSKAYELPNGGDAFAPSGVALSGFGIQVGYEVGLTYDEPALGLAGTLGYHGAFGTDTFNILSGWLAGVARPGDVRIALGPMYQIAFGKGTGVASWFDRGQDANTDPNEDLLYSGLSWGPGIQASVGYGLLDIDPLQGVVELGGAWQSDGNRNYFTFGLRVGLVPAVPRFEG